MSDPLKNFYPKVKLAKEAPMKAPEPEESTFYGRLFAHLLILFLVALMFIAVGIMLQHINGLNVREIGVATLCPIAFTAVLIYWFLRAGLMQILAARKAEISPWWRPMLRWQGISCWIAAGCLVWVETVLVKGVLL